MKVLAYCRVSTLSQQQDGISIDMQRERIAAWCVASGYELEAVFVETMSGGRMDNRPELAKAVALACKLKGILCVFSLSRFSRSVRDTLAMSDRLNRAGASLASLSEKLDSSSAVGRMVFQILSTLAEYEISCTKERTRACLAHLRRSNRRISGKLPFGYTLADDGETLIPNPHEQETIDRITGFRAEGMSLAAIAFRLNGEGVKTREGKSWFPATVKCVIDRQQKLAA